MKTIIKECAFSQGKRITIHLPACYTILTVRVEYNIPRLFVILDDTAPVFPVEFISIRSGEPIDLRFADKYIGAYYMKDGDLSWTYHLFLAKEL